MSQPLKSKDRQCATFAECVLVTSLVIWGLLVAALTVYFASPFFHMRSDLVRGYVDRNTASSYPVNVCEYCTQCALCTWGGGSAWYAQVADAPDFPQNASYSPWGAGKSCLSDTRTTIHEYPANCADWSSLAACEETVATLPCINVRVNLTNGMRADLFCPCNLLEATSPGEKTMDGILLSEYRIMGTTHSNHKKSGWSWLFSKYDYTRPSLATQLDRGLRAIHLRIQRGRAWTAFGRALVDTETTCMSVETCLAEIRTWSSAHPLHSPIVVILQIDTDSIWMPFCSWDVRDHMVELGDIISHTLGSRLFNITASRDTAIGYLRGGIGVVLYTDTSAGQQCLDHAPTSAHVSVSSPVLMAQRNNTLADTTLVEPTLAAVMPYTWKMRRVADAADVSAAVTSGASIVLVENEEPLSVAGLCANDWYTAVHQQNHCAYMLTGVSTGTLAPTGVPTSAP